ncbi:MAG TPA: Tn3 family transposase [Methylococcales bacterium]|nr:Tn3 family transposase [Methylococcales bacterium]
MTEAMARLILLTPEEQAEFENPPNFSDKQRRTVFALSDDIQRVIRRLQGKTNKICFFVQIAYFKACQQFFDPDNFILDDIDYAACLLGYHDYDRNEIVNYRLKKTISYHRKRILKLLGYHSYGENSKVQLNSEAERYVEKQLSPKKIFLTLLKSLQQKRIVFPTYHALSKLISDAYLKKEGHSLNVVKQVLPVKLRLELDNLLITNKKTKQTPIRSFKIINQSMKPRAIQASLAIFNQIKPYFDQAQSTLKDLDLHQDCIRYYATWIRKAKLSQLHKFSDKNNLYLHLIAFIEHQIYSRHDYFVDILLKSVQTAKNSAHHKLSYVDNKSRKERQVAVQKVAKINRYRGDLIDEIRKITASSVLNDTGKVSAIEMLLGNYHQTISEKEQEDLQKCEDLLENFANNQALYNHLESGSVRLQNRVSGIIQTLIFNELTSDADIYQAIRTFVGREGQCDKKSPTNFLSPEESALLNDKNKFRLSLYKTLLFIHAADAIKSGKLNIKYSYRYKAIQDYLISDERWSAERMELLETAGLSDFVDVDNVILDYKNKLSNLYHHVNRRHHDGLNPHLIIDEKDKLTIKTPAQDEKETEFIGDLLTQNGLVSILQVLKDVNSTTRMTSCFEHHSNKHVKKRPGAETFFAGIIGLGCNIGIPKMWQVSTGVNPNTLTNTVNWYFSLKNLKKINTNIVQLIHNLALSEVFVDDLNNTHSSSDGRKVNVKVDSLIASLSFKYFGKDKGVSVYTFIDERQALFHSLVMSASEREAAYVYDGLLDNEVDKRDIHSTDTHGYREGIFAAAPFMKISYAPRIKNVSKQKIYSFSNKKTYESKGYKILPSGQISQRLIKENWDDILRFMATIKLKEETASQLFKRLSSYAKHHPLYKALKEFGRIIKSIFILKYYDDVALRQRIEKQLNRIELSNKFANAVFFANGGEFQQSESEEQALATACKVIIQNAVVLWNYLYLSQLLTNCADEQEREAMILMIGQGSVITWCHINLHGEYDFRRHAANESTFDMGKIFALSLQR